MVPNKAIVRVTIARVSPGRATVYPFLNGDALVRCCALGHRHFYCTDIKTMIDPYPDSSYDMPDITNPNGDDDDDLFGDFDGSTTTGPDSSPLED